MKRFVLILLIMAASSFTYSTASALSTEVTGPNDISVFVDNDYLEFKTKPFNEAGTVMVPFRPIFEKLGLVVSWDGATQSVTGSKEGLTIKLQVGSQKATVNGEVKILPVAPKNVQGSVFIPLRFVGESAQRDVVWDSYWKEVVIADTKGQITKLLGKYGVLLTLEDEKGLLTTLKKDSPAYQYAVETIIPSDFVNYDLTHSLLKVDSIQESGGYWFAVASVETTTSWSTNYQAQINSYEFALIKENGSWKIEGYTTLWTQYTDTPEYPAKKITLSDEEQASIQKLVQMRVDYANDNNVEGINTIFQEEKYGHREALLEYLLHNDPEQSLESTEFISNGVDEAIIKVTIYFDNMNPGLYNSHTEYYMTVKKDKNGVWKFAKVELFKQSYELPQ